MCALAGGDGVHEVGLRPVHLAHLIEDGQHRRQAMSGLAVGGQRLELHVQRQAIKNAATPILSRTLNVSTSFIAQIKNWRGSSVTGGSGL